MKILNIIMNLTDSNFLFIFRYILFFSDNREIILENLDESFFKKNFTDYLLQIDSKKFLIKNYTFIQNEHQMYSIYNNNQTIVEKHRNVLNNFLKHVNENEEMQSALRFQFNKSSNVDDATNLLKFQLQFINIDFDISIYQKIKELNEQNYSTIQCDSDECIRLIRSKFLPFLPLNRIHFKCLLISLINIILEQENASCLPTHQETDSFTSKQNAFHTINYDKNPSQSSIYSPSCSQYIQQDYSSQSSHSNKSLFSHSYHNVSAQTKLSDKITKSAQQKSNFANFFNMLYFNCHLEVRDDENDFMFNFYGNYPDVNQAVIVDYNQFKKIIQLFVPYTSRIYIKFLQFHNSDLADSITHYFKNCSLVIDLTHFLTKNSPSDIIQFLQSEIKMPSFLKSLTMKQKNYIFFQLSNTIIRLEDNLSYHTVSHIKSISYSSDTTSAIFNVFVEAQMSSNFACFPLYFQKMIKFLINHDLSLHDHIFDIKKVENILNSDNEYSMFLVDIFSFNLTIYPMIQDQIQDKAANYILTRPEQTVCIISSVFPTYSDYFCISLIKNNNISVYLDHNFTTIISSAASNYSNALQSQESVLQPQEQDASQSQESTTQMNYHSPQKHQHALQNCFYYTLHGPSFTFHHHNLHIHSQQSNSTFIHTTNQHTTKITSTHCHLTHHNFLHSTITTFTLRMCEISTDIHLHASTDIFPRTYAIFSNCLFTNQITVHCGYRYIDIVECRNDLSVVIHDTKKLHIHSNHHFSLSIYHHHTPNHITPSIINNTINITVQFTGNSVFDYLNSTCIILGTGQHYTFHRLLISTPLHISTNSFDFHFFSCTFQQHARIYIHQPDNSILDVFSILNVSHTFYLRPVTVNIVQGTINHFIVH